MENCRTSAGSVCTTDDNKSVTELVIEAVATLTDTDPTALPILAKYIDPDALAALFTDRSAGHVSFEYHECTVTVRADNTVIAERRPVEDPA